MSPSSLSRVRSLLSLLFALLYAATAMSFSRIVALHLASAAFFETVRNGLTLLLLLAGYMVLGRVLQGQRTPLAEMGWWWGTQPSRYLWQRPGGAAAEGAALGWGMAVLLALPLVLTGSMTPSFDGSAEAWRGSLLGLVAFFLSMAARETVFRGYVLQRLVELTSPVVATLLIAIGFGVVAMRGGVDTRAELLFVMIQQMVLCAAALRTRNLWLPVTIAWAAREVLLVGFGLPVMDGIPNGVVQSEVSGPVWLTGSFSGPPAALFGPVVALIALFIVVRMTRRDVIGDIRGAAYPVDVDASRAPNPVHAAYNDPPKPSLIQIAPVVLPPEELPPEE